MINGEARKNDAIRQKENERKGEILEESETDRQRKKIFKDIYINLSKLLTKWKIL